MNSPWTPQVASSISNNQLWYIGTGGSEEKKIEAWSNTTLFHQGHYLLQGVYHKGVGPCFLQLSLGIQKRCHMMLSPESRETLLYCEGDGAVALVSQRRGRVSILGDITRPHDPGQPAWARGWTRSPPDVPSSIGHFVILLIFGFFTFHLEVDNKFNWLVVLTGIGKIGFCWFFI